VSSEVSDRGTGTARELSRHPELDGLRGLAILGVLATHVVFLDHGDPTWSLRGGFLGVDVFLALSGFLIGGILVREASVTGTIDGARFSRRRAARLLPPLVVLLLVQAAVSLALGSGWAEQALQIVLSLSFTANWQVSFGHHPPLEVLHLWSLSLEVQFYVLAAVGIWACRRHLRRPGVLVAALALGAVAVACWRWWLFGRGVPAGELYVRTDTRLDSLLLGIAGVVVWRDRLLSERVLRAAGVVGVVFLALCWWFVEPTDAWLYRGGFTLLALASVAAVAAATTGGGAVAWIGDRRWLRWVGGISFSLYLWHLPIYVWTVRVLPDVPLWGAALLAIPASFAAAMVSFRYIESRSLAPWRGGRRG
jgi:peptidoglycan/LPS O-acetylase OafA/YrhL